VRIETEETQGLSNLVAQLLTKGTQRKSALEIAQQVESLGGRLEPFSGRDGFGIALQLLSEDVPEGMALLHELVTQSAFAEEELTLQRQLIAKQLQAEDDEIFDVGGRLLRRTFFGQHPYRFDPLGDEDTIGRLSRTACLEFAKRWLVPSNMVLSVFGDVTPEEIARQAGQTFGLLPSEQAPWPSQLVEDPPRDIRAAAQTMAKEQSLVMLGFSGITYGAPDRSALEVMTAVLSGMSGRLFQAVREAHGLSYALGAVNVPGWDPGYLVIYAATRPNEQDRVLELLDGELRTVIEQGFTDEEVAQAKQFLIGAHRLSVQHVAGLAKRVALDELYGMGHDAWTQYEARITGVTVPMVHDAAKRYLTLQQRAQVVISPNGHPVSQGN
jgi:zinc protease